MAFVKIEKSARGSSVSLAEEEIRMGVHLQGGDSSTRSLYFAITQGATRKAGWELKTTDRNRLWIAMYIMEGTGSDAGFLLLVPGEGGYVAGTNKGKDTEAGRASLTCNITLIKLQHYVVNFEQNQPNEIRPHSVEFTYQDGGILIQCPDWLRYNPQSVPEEVKPEPVVEVKPAKKEASPPPRPTKGVVREVVDDVTKGDDNVLHLNRNERRRLASKVTRALAKR